jgi:DNA-binding NtrC family response regulator
MLLVDDEQGILELLAMTLELEGDLDVDVHTELDARRAAARLAGDERFDLVLSDFRMPGMDGIDVLRQARRSHPSGKRVLFTGYNEVPADAERMDDAKLDLLLHKPLLPEDFVQVVRSLLAQT